ncbi:MAG: AAA family ATPase [Nitrospirae bacterium]|uniref:AAA family ATPase n=1 Tax=Candidatus Magnetobacterium casense TaxID=1455061 RepID=UPI00058FAC85|nr:AAA family ATPase [Candidatus Magnetobacterium casensis]MBF0336950.1 AAA family ATPase [Nitrospirota bacterium]
MKIKEIEVKGLFGIFNHKIPINTHEHITIIHGPNGFGKTVMLTIIDSFFKGSYHDITVTPFSELTITFDNGSRFSALKNDADDSKDTDIKFEYTEGKTIVGEFVLRPNRIEDMDIPHKLIEDEIPGIVQVGTSTWFYLLTGEELSLKEVFEIFGKQLSVKKITDEPDWLKEMIKSVSISFIKTQRLLKFAPLQTTKGYPKRSRKFLSVVEEYSGRLVEAIKLKLSDYASLSQELDGTFPARLFKNSPGSNINTDELKAKLDSLEKKRAALMEVGLLDETGAVMNMPDINAQNKEVLSVYAEDMEKKLAIFDEIKKRIELFKNTISTRFSYKSMSIDRENGFTFKTSNGKPLQLKYLSSGEQHELVITYELLFEVSPNSLILIDEPEISLHIEWQYKFLSDLKEIANLLNFDVLIATHSPDIIKDYWDFTIALKGPEK